jgi:hypothetical protein
MSGLSPSTDSNARSRSETRLSSASVNRETSEPSAIGLITSKTSGALGVSVGVRGSSVVTEPGSSSVIATGVSVTIGCPGEQALIDNTITRMISHKACDFPTIFLMLIIVPSNAIMQQMSVH